jgi:predicted DNA-binding protein with PD1-like motif
LKEERKMDYQIGSPGRIAVARFEDGDQILQGLAGIARKENIRAGVFYLVGGMKGGRFVVGPENDKMPPVPVWRELNESHEIVGLGTIFWQGDEPKLHFHGAYGKRDNVKAGCMRENAETFLVLEAIIMEIKGVNAERELDPVSGMALLRLKN